MKAWLKRRKLISLFLAGLLFATPSIIANHDSLIKVALAAQKKVSELTALTGANSASDDLFLIIDTDATESKNITRDELGIGLGGPMGIVIESVPGTAPTATGTDAISIGDGAISGDASGDGNTIAIGLNAVATNAGSIAIGENTDATGASCVAIGGSPTDSSSADCSGTNSVALGTLATATAQHSFAIGTSSFAAASSAVAIGRGANAQATAAVGIGDATATNGVYAVGIGACTQATAANTVAIGGNADCFDSAWATAADAVGIGQHVRSADIGQFGFASGEFAAAGDAQTSIYVLRNSTTDATQTELFSDGSAGDISVASDCTISFRINIAARQTDADGVSAGYFITGVSDNNAGTTALVGSVTTTTIGEDVAGWDVTATADDTNDGINVLVTGAADDAVRWVARAEMIEVCG